MGSKGALQGNNSISGAGAATEGTRQVGAVAVGGAASNATTTTIAGGAGAGAGGGGGAGDKVVAAGTGTVDPGSGDHSASHTSSSLLLSSLLTVILILATLYIFYYLYTRLRHHPGRRRPTKLESCHYTHLEQHEPPTDTNSCCSLENNGLINRHSNKPQNELQYKTATLVVESKDDNSSSAGGGGGGGGRGVSGEPSVEQQQHGPSISFSPSSSSTSDWMNEFNFVNNSSGSVTTLQCENEASDEDLLQ